MRVAVTQNCSCNGLSVWITVWKVHRVQYFFWGPLKDWELSGEGWSAIATLPRSQADL